MIKFLLGAAVMFFVMSLWRRREAQRPHEIEINPRPSMPAAASVEELVRAGRKIEAIKRYREETGCGLKEAKEAVERLASSLGLS